MEESTGHEMIIHLSQRFSRVMFIFFVNFVSFKYDFLVDAVRVIVKIKKYLPRWFRKIYCMARYLFRREGLPICGGHAQLIFAGYGQIKSTNVLDRLHQACITMYTSYLYMQHLGAGHIFFVLTRVFARFQQSCTLETSLQIFWNSIDS